MSAKALSLSISISIAASIQGWAFQANDRVHALADKTVTIIRQSNDQKYQASLLSDVAALLARNREHELAFERFDEAIGKVPKDDTECQLCNIAENLAAAGFYDRAIGTAEKIRDDKQYDENKADGCLWVITRRMLDRKDWDQAKTNCDNIQSPLKRSVALADVAVSNFNRGELQIAESILDKAIATAAKCKEREGQSLLALRFIVQALARGNLKAYASHIVAKETLNAKLVWDWIEIRAMEVECGNVEGVKRASREIHERAKYGLLYLAEAQANAGLVDDARDTARLMLEDEFYHLTVREVAKGFIRAGRLDEALELNETIDQAQRFQDSYYQTLLDVAKLDVEKSNVKRTSELLTKAREIVCSFDWQFSLSDFQAVGEVHGRVGFDSELEAWADSLENPYAKATALIGLANGILDRAKQHQ